MSGVAAIEAAPEASGGRALAVLAFGGLAIGAAPILFRLTDSGPAATSFWRMLFAVPLLALLARRAPAGGGAAAGVGGAAPILLLAGLLISLDQTFWHYGLHFAPVASATVLANLKPVFVTIIAWLALRERPSPLFILALALAICGAAAIALCSPHASGGLDPPLGHAMAITCAFWSAGYLLVMRLARRVHSTTRAMFWSTATSAPILLIIALVLGERLCPTTPQGWAACVGLGLVHVCGQGAIAWALGRLPAATTSMVILIQPVVAAALGWMLFGEAVTWAQFGGAVLALTGVVLAQRATLRAVVR
ncbi:MAG: EamA/RhaT family transporter [Phenylobacterium sp.]|nr:EamA/RhaT family transporter [Phenylobacterium sp.]